MQIVKNNKKKQSFCGTKTEHAFILIFLRKISDMANIKFIVRFPQEQSPQSIYVTARFGRNDKLMYATPIKVEPVFWDISKQRIKSTRYCVYRDSVNEALNSLEAKLNEFMAEVVRDGGKITRDTLRDYLDIHFGKSKVNAPSFHSFFEAFIDTLRTRMNPKRGGQIVTYRTRQEYIHTLSLIKEYERKKRLSLDFQSIDQDLIADFVGYLQSLDYATNTIFHKVKNLKAIMNAAVERGLTDNTRWRYYKKNAEQTFSIALTEEELHVLKEHDFSSEPRLERVRDLFLVGCWTGLRFSDVTRIREENIKDGIITITQSKTNGIVSIPMHPVFQEIWRRYNGNLPTNISNQKFNAYIKEVCRAAGLNEHVLKSMTKGGKRITTQYEKWQLVSSHTARRSFATNLYKSGFPSISIMQITGHKSEASFLRYIKVTPKEHAQMLAEHWKGHG